MTTTFKTFLKASILVLAVSFSLSGCMTAEAPGAIYGTVLLVGSADHSGVLVTVEGTSLSTQSDASGTFVIFDVPQGNYNISASKTGFKPDQVDGIQIAASQAVMNVEFVLVSTTPPGLPQ